MDSLRVEAVENGFVVYEGSVREQGLAGKTWAFESAQTLSDFMHDWGQGNTKCIGSNNAAKGI